MKHSVDQDRLTIEQALERLCARTVSELRAFNAHLPRSMRLERREIDRLVDDLLSAVRETPKRRNASLLDRALWTAGGVLVHAIRQRSRRSKASGALAQWNRHAVDEAGRSKVHTDTLPAPLAQQHCEDLRIDLVGAEDGNRSA